jgi:hypothetical protein
LIPDPTHATNVIISQNNDRKRLLNLIQPLYLGEPTARDGIVDETRTTPPASPPQGKAGSKAR